MPRPFIIVIYKRLASIKATIAMTNATTAVIHMAPIHIATFVSLQQTIASITSKLICNLHPGNE